MFQCAADADFFSSPLLKGSATHSLQAAPPLQQKPAILVSQVKRLELLTDSDEPALVVRSASRRTCCCMLEMARARQEGPSKLKPVPASPLPLQHKLA